MNLRQIRDEAWSIAREISTTDSTRLWKTTEMNRYINRVYRHIARETRCIRDAETAAVCRITVAPAQDLTLYSIPSSYAFSQRTMTCVFGAGVGVTTTDSIADLHVGTLLVSDNLTVGTTVATILSETAFTISVPPAIQGTAEVTYHAWVTPLTYTLNPLILDIDEVKWTNKAWKLQKVSVSKWQINPWWEWVVGMPTEYATDYTNNKIALNFRSYEEDILRLTVKRMPLTDLAADNETPEIRDVYHDYFINGVLMHMYSKQDAQTFNQEKKELYTMRFAEDVDNIKQQEKILDQRLRPNNSLDAFR